MHSFVSDLKYGVRMMARNPAFTLFAVIVLALGIAANTAIFSAADAILVKALPFKDPERLVMVWEDATAVGFPHNTPAPANYVDWKKQNTVFEDMGALRSDSMNLTGTGAPVHIVAARATASLFRVFGIKPALGRLYSSAEDRPGAAKVALISHGLWRDQFGAHTGIVGRQIRLDNESYTVVGVAPEGFTFPTRDTQVWVPKAFTDQELAKRGSHYLQVAARLKPGVTVKQAQSEMAVIADRLKRAYPADNSVIGAVVVPMRDELVGSLKTAMMVLLGAVGFVLLIACANVANLLLARAATRGRELAIRAAIGAGRWRLIRQMLTESVMISASGGILGLLLATTTFDFLRKLIPDSLPPSADIHLNAYVLAFTTLISLGTGVLFGIIPAFRGSRLDLQESLKQGGMKGSIGGGRRMRAALVVGEIALAVVLLSGAGFFIQSFANLRNVELGYRTDDILVLRTALPRAKYAQPSQRIAFFDDVMRRVRSLPGVISCGYTTFLPLTNRGGTRGFIVENHQYPPGYVADSNFRVITPDYLQTMGVQLKSGRYFTSSDGPNSPEVMIVNEAFVRKFLPNENPVGQHVSFSVDPPRWMTIVGVVGNVKQMGIDVPGRAELYRPYTQQKDYEPEDLAIRVAGNPLDLAAAVRREVWAVDSDQPVAHLSTMSSRVDEELMGRRVQMLLLACFAGLAILLASLGIYAVLSYSVTQRRQEIGVRMALGAEPGAVVRKIVADGMLLVVSGLVIGIAGALFLIRTVSTMLYNVRPNDPLTFTSVIALLAAVGFAASYIPARKAARVDPLACLRYE